MKIFDLFIRSRWKLVTKIKHRKRTDQIYE